MIVSEVSLEQPFQLPASPIALKLAASLFLLLLAVGGIRAQSSPQDWPDDKSALVIDGVSDSTVFGMGRSLRITGTVKQGAIAFGGDVFVEGNVEGDVAASALSMVENASG